jgi:hypothetical protein
MGRIEQGVEIMSKKHTIIVIGSGVGEYRCFLDISKEEAEKRYWNYYDGYLANLQSARIKTIEFDEEFGVYDIWPVEMDHG